MVVFKLHVQIWLSLQSLKTHHHLKICLGKWFQLSIDSLFTVSCKNEKSVCMLTKLCSSESNLSLSFFILINVACIYKEKKNFFITQTYFLLHGHVITGTPQPSKCVHFKTLVLICQNVMSNTE